MNLYHMKCRTILIVTYAFTVAFSACNSGTTASAHIFERQQIDSNKLMIKYRYSIDNKEYSDSATIENRVLHKDTITVKVDKGNPAETTPQLEE